MKISGSDSLLNVAKAALLNMTGAANGNKNPLAAKAAQGDAALKQASQELASQISGNKSSYEAAKENVDLSQIWHQGRDWGLGEQQDMAIEARNASVRAANGTTFTDANREAMNQEVQSMSAETTRIGMTNNIHGSHTLARMGTVQEVTEVQKEIPVEEDQTTTTKPQIDVLWVVDRTGSMWSKVAEIQQGAEKMFSALEAKGFDVRMAVESYERKLDSNGSTDFRSDSGAFQADVSNVLRGIGGGLENGLTGLDQAMARFGDKFNPDATKVTVLLSDDYADDFGSGWDPDPNQNVNLQPGADAEQFRQKVADALKSAGSELYVVGGGSPWAINPATGWWDLNPDPATDQDYTDVLNKVGKGGAVKLDGGGKWVDEVTKNFIASAEKNTVKTTSTKVVTEQVTTTTTKLLDDWDLTFQVGPGADEHFTEHYKTSTAETSGLSKADASSTAKAQDAISAIDGAMDFLGKQRTRAGVLEGKFSGIANELDARSLSQQQKVSAMTDAFNPKVDTSLWSLLSMHLRGV